jgi:hypothetical protein
LTHTQLVADFAEFCTTDAFGEELQRFERDNCSMFLDCDVHGEQNLAFTAVWQEYLTIVEAQMDAFCERAGCTAEGLYKEIDEIKDEALVNEFLPQVLLNAEYVNFVTQMKLAAEEEQSRDRASDAALADLPPGDKVNISGNYCAYEGYTFDEANFDAYLQAVGAPWVLRKLIIKTCRNIQNVFIVQDELSFTFKFKMKFFGSRSVTHRFDGEPVFIKNLFGVESFQVASMDADGVKVRVQNHPSLGKDGYTEHSFYLDHRDILNWHWHIVDPANNRDLEHVLKFERQSNGGGRK